MCCLVVMYLQWITQRSFSSVWLLTTKRKKFPSYHTLVHSITILSFQVKMVKDWYGTTTISLTWRLWVWTPIVWVIIFLPKESESLKEKSSQITTKKRKVRQTGIIYSLAPFLSGNSCLNFQITDTTQIDDPMWTQISLILDLCSFLFKFWQKYVAHSFY